MESLTGKTGSIRWLGSKLFGAVVRLGPERQVHFMTCFLEGLLNIVTAAQL